MSTHNQDEIAAAVRAMLRSTPSESEKLASYRKFLEQHLGTEVDGLAKDALDKLARIERWRSSGAAPMKCELLWGEVAHIKTLIKWNTDRDTIRGMAQLSDAKSGGKTKALLHGFKHRGAELQSKADDLYQANKALSYREIIKRVAASMNCSESTVKKYTTNPHKTG